jgi:anti-sigma regulatory factor (Ser/Thr protein kinase)
MEDMGRRDPMSVEGLNWESKAGMCAVRQPPLLALGFSPATGSTATKNVAPCPGADSHRIGTPVTLDDDATGGETNAHPDLLVSGGVGRVEEIEALVGKSGVQADAIQIQQVLVNLLRNAYEATAHLSSPPHEVSVRSHVMQHNVQISVSDNGPGLPDRDVDKLFETFYTTKPDGMGMGLSSCGMKSTPLSLIA